MIRLAFLFAALTAAVPLQAHAVDHGGYGGPTVGVGLVDGEALPLVGGRGGWIIDHRLVLGGALAGVPHFGGWPEVSYWQGGLWAEYRLQPLARVHAGVGAVLGVSVLEPHGEALSAHPCAELTVSTGVAVTSFFHLDLAVGYRLAAGDGTSRRAGGPNASLMFRFGAF